MTALVHTAREHGVELELAHHNNLLLNDRIVYDRSGWQPVHDNDEGDRIGTEKAVRSRKGKKRREADSNASNNSEEGKKKNSKKTKTEGKKATPKKPKAKKTVAEKLLNMGDDEAESDESSEETGTASDTSDSS